MTKVPADEQRLALRILARWEELRGARGLPGRQDIEPAEFGDDWQCCLLIDLDPPGAGARFEHVGSLLAPPDWEAGGRPLAECPPGTLLAAVIEPLPRVLGRGVPISLGGRGAHLGHPVLYRSILLPLAGDGERIDAVLGAANCRAATEAEPGV